MKFQTQTKYRALNLLICKIKMVEEDQEDVDVHVSVVHHVIKMLTLKIIHQLVAIKKDNKFKIQQLKVQLKFSPS